MKPQSEATGLTSAAGPAHRWGMAKAADPPKSKRAERDEKLAAALRANLRRRKAGAAKPQPGGRAEDDPTTA